ncbi:MAG TPA: hypothetical protein IAA15_03850, partial [Candidatus Olsenella pullicola]|nr:hypothetical protein [Candidatus Olsenella pullicola]
RRRAKRRTHSCGLGIRHAEFGPVDAYGIGLPLGSDGVDFVNAWLQRLEDEGLWAELWQLCIGDRAGVDSVPNPPAIGA